MMMNFKIIQAVRDRSKHGGQALAVMFILASRAREDGTCFPSISSISRDTKLCRRTVIRILKELEKSGELIKTVKSFPSRTPSGRQKTNLYRLVPEAMKSTHSKSWIQKSEAGAYSHHLETDVKGDEHQSCPTVPGVSSQVGAYSHHLKDSEPLVGAYSHHLEPPGRGVQSPQAGAYSHPEGDCIKKQEEEEEEESSSSSSISLNTEDTDLRAGVGVTVSPDGPISVPDMPAVSTHSGFWLRDASNYRPDALDAFDLESYRVETVKDGGTCEMCGGRVDVGYQGAWGLGSEYPRVKFQLCGACYAAALVVGIPERRKELTAMLKKIVPEFYHARTLISPEVPSGAADVLKWTMDMSLDRTNSLYVYGKPTVDLKHLSWAAFKTIAYRTSVGIDNKGNACKPTLRVRHVDIAQLCERFRVDLKVAKAENGKFLKPDEQPKYKLAPDEHRWGTFDALCDELMKAQYLIVDGLGTGGGTLVQETTGKLVTSRSQQILPTLWTSNYSPDDLVALKGYAGCSQIFRGECVVVEVNDSCSATTKIS